METTKVATGGKGSNPKTALYVGGLEDSVNDSMLHAAFIPFGEIKDVSIPLDHATGKHRGFGFVEYEEKEDAADAIDNMHNAELFGRVLKVNYAQPPKIKGGDKGWSHLVRAGGWPGAHAWPVHAAPYLCRCRGTHGMRVSACRRMWAHRMHARTACMHLLHACRLAGVCRRLAQRLVAVRHEPTPTCDKHTASTHSTSPCAVLSGDKPRPPPHPTHPPRPNPPRPNPPPPRPALPAARVGRHGPIHRGHGGGAGAGGTRKGAAEGGEGRASCGRGQGRRGCGGKRESRRARCAIVVWQGDELKLAPAKTGTCHGRGGGVLCMAGRTEGGGQGRGIAANGQGMQRRKVVRVARACSSM